MKGLRSDGDPGQRASLLCRALLSRASGRCPVGNDLIVLSHVRLSCDPMDCSPPGSSVHGVSQARILEWVAISSSRWEMSLMQFQVRSRGREMGQVTEVGRVRAGGIPLGPESWGTQGSHALSPSAVSAFPANMVTSTSSQATDRRCPGLVTSPPHARTHARTRTRARARAHAHTRTHARTHTHTCSAGEM